MNFTIAQQIRILKSPKKYLIVSQDTKLTFTNDLSIHLKKDIGDFKIYILEDLRPNLINLEKHKDQLQDLENKLKDLRRPVDQSNWQNAKFNLSDQTE
jgi:hypothetical protein